MSNISIRGSWVTEPPSKVVPVVANSRFFRTIHNHVRHIFGKTIRSRMFGLVGKTVLSAFSLFGKVTFTAFSFVFSWLGFLVGSVRVDCTREGELLASTCVGGAK